MANTSDVSRPSRGSRKLGKYRLIAEIGRGGMASVFLAISQGPANVQKLIVIKERRSAPGDDHEFLTMFLDECRLAARLNHPNVVQTYEVGEDGDRFFIAMEYLEGQPLSRVRSRMAAEGTVTLDHQARVFCDALAGLHYAHDLADFDGTPLNVVHRDVTPQNVFITYAGQIKLVDFGIAKANDSSSETKTGVLKGKVSYMSPEQAKGDVLDRRADVFSVGVMLWEAITKRRMWKGSTDIAILGRLIQGEVPTLGAAAEGVDPELVRICERALEPDREKRYATAAEMQHDLEQYLSGRKGATAREVGRLVSDHFSADRAEIKSIIDHHVRNLRESSTELARIQLDRSGQTPSGSGQNPYADEQRKTSTSVSALPAVATPLEPTRAGKRPSPLLLGVTAIGVAALTTGGLVLALRNTPAPAASPKASTQAPVETAKQPPQTVEVTADPVPPAPPRMDESVQLKIEGVPKDAKIYVDGKQVGTGAYNGTLPKDGKKHKLVVEAGGMKSYEEELESTSDQRLRLRLDASSAGAGGGPRVVKQATADPHPPGPAPTPGPAPRATSDDLGKPGQAKRQLEDDNPYKKKAP